MIPTPNFLSYQEHFQLNLAEASGRVTTVKIQHYQSTIVHWMRRETRNLDLGLQVWRSCRTKQEDPAILIDQRLKAQMYLLTTGPSGKTRGRVGLKDCSSFVLVEKHVVRCDGFDVCAPNVTSTIILHDGQTLPDSYVLQHSTRVLLLLSVHLARILAMSRGSSMEVPWASPSLTFGACKTQRMSLQHQSFSLSDLALQPMTYLISSTVQYLPRLPTPSSTKAHLSFL